MNIQKHVISLSCLVLLGFLGIACNSSSSSTNQENAAGASSGDASDRILEKAAFAEAIKRSGAVLIDVRMIQEFEQGHIEDAININFFDPEFKRQLLDLNKNKKYYLYDKNEKTAYRSMKFMEENDFKNVYILKGGYVAWKDTAVK